MAQLFHKHYNAPNQLVDLLKKRGLIIEDDALAQSKFPRRMSRPWLVGSVSTNRIFYDICILKYFTDIVDSDNKMMENLTNLLRDYPMVDTKAMGFPDGWRNEPLWVCQ